MAQLKTAEQMIRYCQEYGTDGGVQWNRNKSHFRVIADDLQPGEVALIAFTGLMNYFNWGFAVTPKRIIIGQKRLFGRTVKSIYLDKIHGITLRTGPVHGFLEIDTIKDTVEICVKPETASDIRDLLQAAIENGSKMQTDSVENSSVNQRNFAVEGESYTVMCRHCGTKYKGGRCPECGLVTMPEYETPRRSKKFVVVATGAVALIAVVSIGGYILFFSDSEDRSKNSSEPDFTDAAVENPSVSSEEIDETMEADMQTVSEVEQYLAEHWDGETSVRIQDQILEVVLCASGEIPDFLDEAQTAASEISSYTNSNQNLIRSTIMVKAGLDFSDDIYLTFFDENLSFRADEAGEYQEPNDEFITMDEFNQIADGMTYQDVVNIIGSTGELVSSVDLGDPQYETKMYSWLGKGIGANAIISFQGGTVYSKSQFGLE